MKNLIPHTYISEGRKKYLCRSSYLELKKGECYLINLTSLGGVI